jgi:hypothetical protein
MRCAWWVLLVAGSGCASVPSDRRADPAPEADLQAARALFEKNLRAIRERDREAYLSCYRPSEALVRAGPKGVIPGYGALADETPADGSDDWPETLEASDLSVHWLAPGVVYGQYAYRVVIDGVASTGRSERLFLRVGDHWTIAVTTAFGSPAVSDPPSESLPDPAGRPEGP